MTSHSNNRCAIAGLLSGSAHRAAAFVALCAIAGSGAAASAIPVHGLRLPATFTGDMPCADCQAVRHRLDLWPDQVFHLVREWVGKEYIHAEIGHWRMDPSRHALVLRGGAEMPLQFEIEGPQSLRLLDLSGAPIDSSLPYSLRSDGTLLPGDLPSLLMGGEVIYDADGARFTECLTGRSYAIAPGAEALELQRAHLRTVPSPGTPLYVSLEGSLRNRAGTNDERGLSTVAVERFVNTWPNQRCERSKATASLTNTYWRIVASKGEALPTTPGRREPHIIFRSTDRPHRYVATVGCNSLGGGFETGGDAISITGPTSTRMGCPAPLAGIEQRFGAALGGVRRWRNQGNTLELRDDAGNTLMLMEAVYL